MKIGILGGTGFLGKNLSEFLKKNHEVFVASRRTGVDGRKVECLLNWIQQENLDCIINLAAECGGIGLNQTNPYDLWLTTTQITSSVLEASRIIKLKKLVMIGTVCSYAKYCKPPFNEKDLMNYGFPEETNAAYGVSKLNGLFGCKSYRKQFDLNAIYLIPVNMYGKWDNFDPKSSHVIPALIRRIILAKENNDESLVVWGDGSASREFLYAEDCAEAIELAVDKYNEEEPINIGTGIEITINDLVKEIKEIVGYKGEIIWDSSKPNGQPRRQLDVKFAKENLGFEAKTTLKKGLIETINWYVQNKTNNPTI